MKTLILLIDMDGVVADFNNYIVAKHNIMFPEDPIPFSLEQVPASSSLLEGKTHPVHPLHDERYADKLNSIMRMPNFFAEIPPLPGAVEAVDAMRDEGHLVYFVTSPKTSNPTCADDKIHWIRKHFGHDMRHHVIITKDKTAVKGDLLFDDRVHIVGKCKPDWKHVLFSTPFNLYAPKERVAWVVGTPSDSEHPVEVRNSEHSVKSWREVVSQFQTSLHAKPIGSAGKMG